MKKLNIIKTLIYVFKQLFKMVKNTTGGTGTKGLARKHQSQTDGGRLRLPECELEQFGIVTKMLGNGMCEIHTNENVRLIGHIRNKFRGKQKRHNMLSVQSIVLIGLREWENPCKNCDIMTMYESGQIEQLRNIPGIKINRLLEAQLDATNVKLARESNVRFTEDIDEEQDMLVPAQRVPTEEFLIETVDEVDFDDI
jgi:initiation factor 1A